MKTRRSSFWIALLVVILATCSALPPNTSFATIPISYYGANWDRNDSNIDMLTRMRIIVLMQMDGDCWVKCCPHRDSGDGSCQPRSMSKPENASLNIGCDPGCDQQGKQVALFRRIHEAAQAAGRPPPHGMVYMNAVYDWPFDASHGRGAETVDVLDIHGVPHTEMCDPRIYPSFLLDYGRAAGRAAFLDSVKKYVVDGDADGVFLDCFAQIPMGCDNQGQCFARRNHVWEWNTRSAVSKEQVTNYIMGKNETLTSASQLIMSKPGGTLAAFTYNAVAHKDPHGANMAVIHIGAGNPSKIIDLVRKVFANGYKYVIIQPVGFSTPTRQHQETSMCSDYDIARFLLAMEEGCFLECNGWNDDFARPLGAPTSPAIISDGMMTRRFSSGTEVQWVVGTTKCIIRWATELQV